MVAVVLLPGMDGSGVLFSDFVEELGARSIVISYPSDQPLGYPELIELVRSSLPSDEQFILLAESFSGPIAISLAAELPPQLGAVILVCSFAKSPVPAPLWLLKRFALLVPWWRVPVSLAARLLLGRFSSAALESKLERSMKAVLPEVWKARLMSVLAADERSTLCRVQAPLLYLRARDDRVVFPSASAVICDLAPWTKVVEIDSPHFLLQARPKESAAAVRAFACEHGLAL